MLAVLKRTPAEATAAMSTPLSFRQGDNVLRGRFFRALGGDAVATVLLLQGSPGNPEDVLGLGERLSQCSYDVLTFNYSGTQDSEGLSSFETAQLDIAAAYRYLLASMPDGVDPGRLILGGWSYGGGMALTYASNHPEVTEVFSVAGTDHGAFMREYESSADYRAMIDEIFDEMGTAPSPWRLAPGATPREVREQAGDVDDVDLLKAVPNLTTKRILLVGGWDDDNIRIETHLLPLYRSLMAQGADHVSIATLQDDHSFGNSRKELAELLVTWMQDVDAAVDGTTVQA